MQPPWQTTADVAPLMAGQVGLAFEQVLASPGLDLRTREILTCVMLAVLGGVDAQLAFHSAAALRAGVSEGELIEALTQVGVYAGVPRALNGIAVARQVLAERGATSVAPPPRTVVATLVAAVRAGDAGAAAPILGEQVRYHASGLPRALSGRAAVTGELMRPHAEIRSGRTRWEEPVAGPSGQVYLSGTHDGADGERFHLVAEFVVEQGLITTLRIYRQVRL